MEPTAQNLVEHNLYWNGRYWTNESDETHEAGVVAVSPCIESEQSGEKWKRMVRSEIDSVESLFEFVAPSGNLVPQAVAQPPLHWSISQDCEAVQYDQPPSGWYSIGNTRIDTAFPSRWYSPPDGPNSKAPCYASVLCPSSSSTSRPPCYTSVLLTPIMEQDVAHQSTVSTAQTDCLDSESGTIDPSEIAQRNRSESHKEINGIRAWHQGIAQRNKSCQAIGYAVEASTGQESMSRQILQDTTRSEPHEELQSRKVMPMPLASESYEAELSDVVASRNRNESVETVLLNQEMKEESTSLLRGSKSESSGPGYLIVERPLDSMTAFAKHKTAEFGRSPDGTEDEVSTRTPGPKGVVSKMSDEVPGSAMSTTLLGAVPPQKEPLLVVSADDLNTLESESNDIRRRAEALQAQVQAQPQVQSTSPSHKKFMPHHSIKDRMNHVMQQSSLPPTLSTLAPDDESRKEMESRVSDELNNKIAAQIEKCKQFNNKILSLAPEPQIGRIEPRLHDSLTEDFQLERSPSRRTEGQVRLEFSPSGGRTEGHYQLEFSPSGGSEKIDSRRRRLGANNKYLDDQGGFGSHMSISGSEPVGSAQSRLGSASASDSIASHFSFAIQEVERESKSPTEQSILDSAKKHFAQADILRQNLRPRNNESESQLQPSARTAAVRENSRKHRAAKTKVVGDVAEPKQGQTDNSTDSLAKELPSQQRCKVEETVGVAEPKHWYWMSQLRRSAEDSADSYIAETLRVAKSTVTDLALVLDIAKKAIQIPNGVGSNEKAKTRSIIQQKKLAAEKVDEKLRYIIQNATGVASHANASDEERARAHAEIARAAAGRAALHQAQEEVSEFAALLGSEQPCTSPDRDCREMLHGSQTQGVLPWLLFEKHRDEGASYVLPNILALGKEAVEPRWPQASGATPRKGGKQNFVEDQRTRVREEEHLHPHRYRINPDRHRLETPTPSTVAASLLTSSSAAPAHNTIRPGARRAWH